MLIKVSKIIGAHVYTLQKGEDIEDIDDVIYDPLTNKVVALLVSSGRFFYNAKVIPLNEIKSIGSDAVIVESNQVLKDSSEVAKEVSSIAEGNTYLTKNKVITEDGKNLGIITDLLFDTKTGNVEEFEISQGGLIDVTSGKKYLNSQDVITIGKDAIIVKSLSKEKLKDQAEKGGIRGVLKRGAKKIKPTGESISEKLKEEAKIFAKKTQEKAREIQKHPRTQQFLHQISQDKRITKRKRKENKR